MRSTLEGSFRGRSTPNVNVIAGLEEPIERALWKKNMGRREVLPRVASPHMREQDEFSGFDTLSEEGRIRKLMMLEEGDIRREALAPDGGGLS